MSFDRFQYELQILGKKVVLAPIVLVLCLSLFAVILHVVDTEIDRFFTAVLEIIIPLMTGMLIATITTQDPVVELHLTMPLSYAATVLYRLLITLLWSGLITLMFSCTLFLVHFWFVPRQISAWSQPSQLLVGQLIWLPTLLWFSVVGFGAAQLTHSRSASASLLSAIWILSMFVFALPLNFPDWMKMSLYLFPSTLTPQIGYWLTNRVVVLIIALLLFPFSWLLLRGTEGVLKSASEE